MLVEHIDGAIGMRGTGQGIGGVEEGAGRVTRHGQAGVDCGARIIHGDDGAGEVDSRGPAGERAIQRSKQEPGWARRRALRNDKAGCAVKDGAGRGSLSQTGCRRDSDHQWNWLALAVIQRSNPRAIVGNPERTRGAK